MIGGHVTSHTIQGRWWKCTRFSSIYPLAIEHPLGVVLPVMIWYPSLVAYTMVDKPQTSHMHLLMNWEKCQHIDWWWEVMIYYHSQFKVEDESALDFIHLHMAHHWGDVLTVWMWSSCLAVCTVVDKPHICIHWLIDCGNNTCMEYWSSWCIIHHPRHKQEGWQFSSIHAGPPLKYCAASMDMIRLLGCLHWYIRLTHDPTDELTGMATLVWMVGSPWFIIHHPR